MSFWVALFGSVVAFSLIWSFAAESWTNISAYIQVETGHIQSYKPTQKTNSSLAELLLK